MTDDDGRRLAELAIDALARAQERTADPNATIVGATVTLVVDTCDGIQVITQTSDNTASFG